MTNIHVAATLSCGVLCESYIVYLQTHLDLFTVLHNKFWWR